MNIQQNIEKCIKEYDTITLDNINSVNLLDRHDTKFIFSVEELPGILEDLKDHYKVLEIEENRSFSYENLYFDTSDLMMYKQHHNGKLNRYKIRYRKYKETDICFFEIKRKSNKYKTLKERIPSEDIQTRIEGSAYSLVQEQLDINPETLNPQLRVNYSRITLLNEDIPEKLTFDTNLFFKNSVRQKAIPNLVIAEVKHNRYSSSPLFLKLMRKRRISSMNLSKYCTGTILTHPDVKYNRFKSKLIFINKISENANA